VQHLLKRSDSACCSRPMAESVVGRLLVAVSAIPGVLLERTRAERRTHTRAPVPQCQHAMCSNYSVVAYGN
jgi:hypothetical protein